MSGDIHQDKDQERFEDYLELEHFIEELQAGHAAHPPGELTPEKARIYRMAALFRSASPDDVTPRPEFAAELQARLEQELQQPPKTRHFPFISKKPQTKPRVSRRALLAAAVAASTWLFVTTLAEVGVSAIRFATNSIVGYIIRNDGDNGESLKEGPVIAVS